MTDAPARVEPAATDAVEAFGATAAAPGAVRTLSVPFESRVRKVLVADGQVVEEGAPLAEIEPSPDSRLLLGEGGLVGLELGDERPDVDVPHLGMGVRP